MSLWTPALTAAFEAAVVSPRVSLVVRPGDPAHAIVTGAAKALVGALPAVVRPITGAALDPLADVMARVSVTVPVPLLAPVIVLSSVAVADPVSEAATLLHELTHVVQIEAAGRAQAVADYTSGELRAQREADAAAAGRWMRYVLTGELPDAARLSDLYCLDAGDAALAVAIQRAHVATIAAGLVPNIRACVAAARWLHASPLVPDEIRARVPALPEGT